jgi:UDPglucose 6-dehydrogenase
MTTSRISVLGLGKVGACVAAGIASRGYDVVGIDVNPRTIELVNQGHSPVAEPGLDELMAASREHLRATADVREAVLATDVTMILVATPTDERGGFTLKYAAAAAEKVGQALAEKDGYHLVVIVSTVLPGSTRYGLVPILEQASGKRCGVDFGVCYSPEFITLGTVVHDFLQPDFILIGESDERAGETLESLYKAVCENNPPIARMTFENAELTKIANAAYVTMKITFANTLAELCEQLPGGNVDAVTGALGFDSRIGGKYLKGGTGYGGPCFPRDNPAFAWVARSLAGPDDLPVTTDRLNRRQPGRLIERLERRLDAGATVALLGLSYKPDSPVVDESQSVEIAERLAAQGYSVVVYDPAAEADARRLLGDSVSYAPTIEQAIAGADAVVVLHPSKTLAANLGTALAARTEPIVVFDCWRGVRQAATALPHVTYLAVGIGPEDSDLAERLTDLWQQPQAVALS